MQSKSNHLFPGGKLPCEPIADLTSDFAVEFVRPGTTGAELERRRKDYFRAGVRMIWEIDVRNQVARSWLTLEKSVEITASERLDAEEVVAGFALDFGELLHELQPPGRRQD